MVSFLKVNSQAIPATTLKKAFIASIFGRILMKFRSNYYMKHLGTPLPTDPAKCFYYLPSVNIGTAEP